MTSIISFNRRISCEKNFSEQKNYNLASRLQLVLLCPNLPKSFKLKPFIVALRLRKPVLHVLCPAIKTCYYETVTTKFKNFTAQHLQQLITKAAYLIGVTESKVSLDAIKCEFKSEYFVIVKLPTGNDTNERLSLHKCWRRL